MLQLHNFTHYFECDKRLVTDAHYFLSMQETDSFYYKPQSDLWNDAIELIIRELKGQMRVL